MWPGCTELWSAFHLIREEFGANNIDSSLKRLAHSHIPMLIPRIPAWKMARSEMKNFNIC